MSSIAKYNSSHSQALVATGCRDGPLKLVILTGAGISCEAPSNIPLGMPLTDAYIDLCLGSGFASVLRNRWTAISKEAELATGVSCPSMRLESIIEKVDDVDCEFGYTKAIDGFREFACMPPNKQHFHIASLMKRGAHVITANFDCGIEKVFDSCYANESAGGAMPMYDDSLGVYTGSVVGHNVYHYHGVGTDPEGLGATVKRIRYGFLPGFAGMLKKWFQDGCSLLCVGFGCVDFFDATQFFEGVPEGEFPGTAVFCNHSNRLTHDLQNYTIADMKRHTDFMKGFKEKHITFGNTEDVLAEIVRFVCGDDEVEQNRSTVDAMASVQENAWRKSFDQILANVSRDRRMYYVTRVMNQFGFYLTDDDIEALKSTFDAEKGSKTHNPLIEYKSAQVFLREAANSYLSHIERMGGQTYFEDRARFAIQSRSVGFDFKMICKDMEFYPKAALKIEQLYDAAKNKRAALSVGKDSLEMRLNLNTIENEVHAVASRAESTIGTKYVVAFKEICEKLVVKFIRGHLNNGDYSAVDDASRCSDALAALPMNHFLFSSHQISVLKMYNLMHVISKRDDACLISAGRMAELALQVCFTDEIPRIYRHEALICMMRLISDADDGRLTDPEKSHYRSHLHGWKNKTEDYLEVLKVKGAWSANQLWMNAVDEFLSEASANSSKARESALKLVGRDE